MRPGASGGLIVTDEDVSLLLDARSVADAGQGNSFDTLLAQKRAACPPRQGC
ncbi:MAG: hypothetical protein R2873_10060 [Caldilineaceae bacterium]